MASTKKLPIRPLGGNILVRPLEQEETTPAGLVISATAKTDKPQEGEVLALGTGKLDAQGKTVAWNLQVGDRVYFKKYAPDEVEFDGEKFLIMAESDVVAVIEK